MPGSALWIYFVPLLVPALLAAQLQTADPSMLRATSPLTQTLRPILSVGDAPGGYAMIGIPDGLGAYSNGDGTFTLTMNHEIGQTTAHAHGTGAIVSQWQIRGFDVNPSLSLAVHSGQNAFGTVYDWNGSAYVAVSNPRFHAFCSAYVAGPEDGFDRYIHLTGEETMGTNNLDGISGGQAVAVFDNTAYTLPRLGRFSHENTVVLRGTGTSTVVMGLDDDFTGTDAQLYMYVGQKTASSNVLEKNGLSNGSLYTLKVGAGLASENSLTKGTSYASSFVPVNWNQTGDALEAQSIANGAVSFTRIEDGAADPNNPNVFYFAVTGSSSNASNPNGRIYRLTYNNVTNPTSGATLEVVLDGSEGIKGPDNIAMNAAGQLMIQEDPSGLTGRDSSIWMYDTRSKNLVRVAEVDTPLAQSLDGSYSLGKWETSGIIDASDLLGEGWWLLDVQAHYNLGGGLLQDGQLLAMNVGSIDPGDTDLDGDVDLNDLSTLAAFYGVNAGGNWAKGDFDADGDVDLSDLSNLAAYYASGETEAFADFQSLVSVPEPAAALVLLFGFHFSRKLRRGSPAARSAAAHFGVPTRCDR